jgi:hypothetical protein
MGSGVRRGTFHRDGLGRFLRKEGKAEKANGKERERQRKECGFDIEIIYARNKSARQA